MGYVLGIDLGTTNCCMSFVDESGSARVIANAEGEATTPSVVAFDKEGGVLVGAPARNQATLNPTRTFASVKRHIGSDWKTNDIDDKRYTPQEISARLLMKLKRDAEAYLNEEITEAVVTVPAYFTDQQRQATKEAGEIAGLKIRRVMSEPTAAALAYGLDRGKESETILVFDLGGGTFDVSLLEVGKDEDGVTIEVKATEGDNQLGGDDWDDVVAEWIKSKLMEQCPNAEISPASEQRIREAAETAKKQLSAASKATITLPYIAQDTSLELSLYRSDFEEMTKPLLERTREPFTKALESAGMTNKDIDHVVLVGGSTRMPAVSDIVRELTQKEPNKGVNPDEVVALGAAIQGDVVAPNSSTSKAVLLVDVTPLSIGVETLGGKMSVLIPKNTAIPHSVTKEFTTAEDNQDSVEIQVFQGERPRTADNHKLGSFALGGIVPAERGVPRIELTMRVDQNGILQLSARDIAGGQEKKVSITGGSSLSDAQIASMIEDAKKHQEEDEKRRKADEVRDKAERSLTSLRSIIKQNQETLDDDVCEEVGEAISNMENAIKSDDADKVNSAYAILQEKQKLLGKQLYGTSSQNGWSDDN